MSPKKRNGKKLYMLSEVIDSVSNIKRIFKIFDGKKMSCAFFGKELVIYVCID